MKRFMVVLTGVIMAAHWPHVRRLNRAAKREIIRRPEPHRSPLLTERLRNRRW